MNPNPKASLKKPLSALIRRLRAKPERIYKWQRSPSYWMWRHRWLSTKLRFASNTFGVRRKVRSQRDSASILRNLIKAISGQIILALVLVSGLQVIASLLYQIGWIPRSLHLNSALYATILTVIASVSGVFLALYFTTLSIVASTVYVQVQTEVRNLLLQEKVGRYYSRMVAFVGAISILLLTAQAIGIQPGILNLVVVISLGVVAILSFVVLGSHTFDFFDPTLLADDIVSDLMKWMRAATPLGFQWEQPSFQTHYQHEAERLLGAYWSIIRLAGQEKDLRGWRLRRLATLLLKLLEYYVSQKARIPTESLWFKRTPQQQNWLTASDVEVGLALNTGTPLQPTAIPDLMWVEERVQKMLIYTMRALLQGVDAQDAVILSDRMLGTFNMLGEQLAIDESLRLFHALKPLFLAKAHEISITASTEEEKESLREALALNERMGLLLINILLGFSRRLDMISSGALESTLASITWSHPQQIYSTGFPRAVIKELEKLSRHLAFELAVDSSVITPGWYQQQLVAAMLVTFVSEAASSLVKELENTFAPDVERLITEQRYTLAAQLIQGGREACKKYSYHFAKAQERLDELVTLRRVTDLPIPWPSIDWDQLNKSVHQTDERLIRALAQAAASLIRSPQLPDQPDYLGQTYALLTEECYRAMASGNEELFQHTFPAVFQIFPLVHDQQIKHLEREGYDKIFQVRLTAEIIVDILELSGYALIYSELDSKNYWGYVRAAWDTFLNEHPNPQTFVESVNANVELTRNMPMILPQDLLRTRWESILRQQLDSRGLLQDTDIYFQPPEDSQVQHPSPVIRALISQGDRGLFLNDAHNIFLAVYVMQRPEAQNWKNPHWKVSSFADALQRAKKQDKNVKRGSREGE